MNLDCRLPQGSSLGPLKFIIYAAEIQEVVNRHGISFHGFADDSQLSKHMQVSEIHVGKRAMVDCSGGASYGAKGLKPPQILLKPPQIFV